MSFIIIIALIIFLIWYFNVGKKEKQKNTILKVNIQKSSFNSHIIVYLSGVHIASRKNYILKNGWDSMPVDLIAEPKNKYDKNAISVSHEGKIIGYIPSDKTDLVHPILLKPHFARFDSMEEEDSYSNPGQIHLRIYLRIEFDE